MLEDELLYGHTFPAPPELINLRTFRPLDTECITNSVKKTHRLINVDVETGWPSMAECELFSCLEAPIQSTTDFGIPMPCSEGALCVCISFF
uniref:Transketolase_C domain-containing protein n=1 Tax=Onchocerca volvulus TaxID=6282 RepID=A0A8R1XYV1_ONCVO